MLYLMFILDVRTLSEHFFCISFALHLHFANVYSYPTAIIALIASSAHKVLFKSISFVILKLWLQTQSSTKLQIIDDHAVKSLNTLAPHRKGVSHSNMPLHKEWDLFSTPYLCRRPLRWRQRQLIYPPGFLPSLLTDSASCVPVHAVAVLLCARRLRHQHSTYAQISEPGQRRHFGTYLHKIIRWPFFSRLLVACCRVGKKRTEPSGWTRMCCCL